MRSSTKQEHSSRLNDRHGMQKNELLLGDDPSFLFEQSSEFGLHGRDVGKLKQQLKRT